MNPIKIKNIQIPNSSQSSFLFFLPDKNSPNIAVLPFNRMRLHVGNTF